MKITIFMIISIVLSTCTVWTDQAFASCDANIDYDSKLKSSELVFTGTVTRLDNYGGPQKITFLVHDVIKGEIDTTKYVLENTGKVFLENGNVMSSSVNVDYKIGKTYKAYVENGNTDSCTTKLTAPPDGYIWEPGPEDGNYYSENPVYVDPCEEGYGLSNDVCITLEEMNKDLPDCGQNPKHDFGKCKKVSEKPDVELNTVLDGCACRELGNECIDEFLSWWDDNYYIDNVDCEFLDKVEGSPTYGQAIDRYDQRGPNYGEEFCTSIRTERLAASDTVENIYRVLLWQDICNELGITKPFVYINKHYLAVEHILNQTKSSTRDAVQAYVESDRDIQKAIDTLTGSESQKVRESTGSYELDEAQCLGGRGMILNDKCERIGRYDIQTGIPIVNDKAECDKLDGIWHDDRKLCDSKYAPAEYRLQFGPAPDVYDSSEEMRIASDKVHHAEESMGFGSGTAIFDESGFQLSVMIIVILIGGGSFFGLMFLWRKRK